MRSSYLVYGMSVGDAIFSLGQLSSVQEDVARVRCVHTGTLAAVMWACKVDSVVLKAALAIGMPIVKFLDTVLPPDAHLLCKRHKISISLRRQNSLWASPESYYVSSWPSRGELIKTIARAVWLPGWINIIVAPGTAAGLACRAATAGIIVVGPQSATEPQSAQFMSVQNTQFDSWYTAGTKVPLY